MRKRFTGSSRPQIKGLLSAQTALAQIYETGVRVPKDYAQAIIWYRKAAEGGDAAAQLILADHYAWGGPAVAEDRAEALFWYRKAAESDNEFVRDIAKSDIVKLEKENGAAERR